MLLPVSIHNPYQLDICHWLNCTTNVIMMSLNLVCTILAGTGTLVNVAQQQEQMERQERLEEERRQEAAEEAARNSAERKILVVRGALTTQLKPPQVQLPMCDLYEAEALINRLVQRSPVLVNGYQGTGKSTLLSRMVASRRSDVDVTFNQPAYRLSLRKCLRDRANEPGVLFRLIAEEIGLGKAVQEGFVHDNFENAHQYFVGALEDLRRDGYEPCLFVVDDIEILFNDAHPQLRQQAGGWCEWLLELHEAGLIRLVLVTSAGGVYLDLINCKYTNYNPVNNNNGNIIYDF
jgi:heme exporter protein D